MRKGEGTEYTRRIACEVIGGEHRSPYAQRRGGAGIKSFPGTGLYCTSKAALQVISQVFAMENAPDNIRVNCILPALVEDTELAGPAVGEENISQLWDKLRPLHPMGRNGKPAGIADAALFFASELSSWITGTLFNVDGGRHMATNRPPV